MLDGWQEAIERRPVAWIIAASLLLRLTTSALLVVAHLLLPTWDAEVTTLAYPISRYLEPFVRWDTVHFVHIALDGYTTDRQSAFLPGLPALMRLGGEAVHRMQHGEAGATASDVVLAGIVSSTVATTGAAIVLYRWAIPFFPMLVSFPLLNPLFLASRLTRQLFPTRSDFAALTVVMFLLAPSRPTLHAVPYTEPFAAFFTFLGMLLFARSRSFLAAVAWAIGTVFRAQGVVLGVGFFGRRYLLQDVWKEGPGVSARQVRVSKDFDSIPLLAAIYSCSERYSACWSTRRLLPSFRPCRQFLSSPSKPSYTSNSALRSPLRGRGVLRDSA